MTVQAVKALQLALVLIQAPRSSRPRPEDRLPDGMLLLLKLVAGEEQAGVDAQSVTGESVPALREAAGFYIQQVMFAPEADSYRVLGVDADSSDERLREHYRWLARWLHPDRNPDAWEVVYADRVNQAWQNLRTPDRRERYDQALALAEAPETGEWVAEAVVPNPGDSVHFEASPLLPKENYLRWLPHAIFIGLGVTVVAIVAVFYAIRWSAPTPTADGGAESMAIATLPVRVSPAPTAPTETVSNERPSLLVSEVVADGVAAKVPVAAPVPPAATLVSPRETIAPLPQPSLVLTAKPASKLSATSTESKTTSTPIPEPLALRRRETAPSHPSVVIANSAPPTRKARLKSNPEAAPELAASQPSATTAENSGTAETPPKIRQVDANRLLNHFTRAYEDGNLDGMRALFSSDVSARRGNRDAVLADYDQLFESSQERSLHVRDVSWFTSGETLTIIASFEATVTSRGGRPHRTRGDLRLDLRREDAEWRIVRVQHDERPG